MYGWQDSGGYGSQLFKRIREQQRLSALTRARMDRMVSEQAFLEDFDANLPSYVDEISPEDFRPILNDFLKLADTHWDTERKRAFFQRVVSLRDDHKIKKAWSDLAAEVASFKDSMRDAWRMLTPEQQQELVRELEKKRPAKGDASSSAKPRRRLHWGKFFVVLIAAAFWGALAIGMEGAPVVVVLAAASLVGAFLVLVGVAD